MFDVCVVGGGMVGSAAALGLAKLGLSVAIIERSLPSAYSQDDPPDMRVSALSTASEALLDKLEAWSEIENMRGCRYQRLAVWEHSQCRTEFNSLDVKRDYLGHIIENRVIQLGLHQALAKYDNVEWFIGTAIESIKSGDTEQLKLVDGKTIEARLLIAADGGNSQIRRMAAIGTQGWQYAQKVFAVSIRTKNCGKDITWQQFHPTGPRAFLPMYDDFASLVWYDNADRVQELAKLDEQSLIKQIKASFPAELGDFDLLNTAQFPITRMHANQYVKGNILLIGDAAHTINPLAGQGVNLGFKDVKALLEVVENNLNSGKKHLEASDLVKYEMKRRKDNLLMMSTMDALYIGFSQTNPVLKFARNAGLWVAQRSGPIKNHIMKYAMGE